MDAVVNVKMTAAEFDILRAALARDVVAETEVYGPGSDAPAPTKRTARDNVLKVSDLLAKLR